MKKVQKMSNLTKIKTLESGSFGTVFLAEDNENNLYVLKIVEKLNEHTIN